MLFGCRGREGPTLGAGFLPVLVGDHKTSGTRSVDGIGPVDVVAVLIRDYSWPRHSTFENKDAWDWECLKKMV